MGKMVDREWLDGCAENRVFTILKCAAKSSLKLFRLGKTGN